MNALALTVNDRPHRIDAEPGALLLDILRDNLGLTGTRDACRRGECGACTVLVGGRAVLACLTFAAALREPIETIEGLSEEARRFREALADGGGFQCGYCTDGFIVRAVSLMRDGLPASDDELRHAMGGNLCRCTGYQPIIAALRSAAAMADRAGGPAR